MEPEIHFNFFYTSTCLRSHNLTYSGAVTAAREFVAFFARPHVSVAELSKSFLVIINARIGCGVKVSHGVLKLATVPQVGKQFVVNVT